MSGVVVDGQTGRALRGAVVYIGIQSRGAIDGVPRVLTDAAGRFVFKGLPPSERYSLLASRFGYLDGGFGINAAGRPSFFSVKASEQVDGIRVPLWRPAAIAGTVRSDSGEPVMGISVRAFRIVPVAGGTQLAEGPGAETDDRGIFRIAQLIPGSYIVGVQQHLTMAPLAGAEELDRGGTVATSRGTEVSELQAPGQLVWPGLRSERLWVFESAFYGGTNSAALATPVSVVHGSEFDVGELVVRRTPAFALAGRAVGMPAETDLAGLLVTLRRPDAGDPLSPPIASTVMDGRGRFRFVGVTPGSYVVTASSRRGGFAWQPINSTRRPPARATDTAPRSSFLTVSVSGVAPGTSFTDDGVASSVANVWGGVRVEVVDEDVTDLGLIMSEASTLAIRVVTEGDSAPSPPTPGPAWIVAEPASGNPSLGLPSVPLDRSAGSVMLIRGVMPGAYVLRFAGTESRLVRSLACRGATCTADRLEVGVGGGQIDVVVTSRAPKPVLSGTVRDTRGQVQPTAIVLAFPVDRARWTRYGLNPSRIAEVSVSGSGVFQFSTLPAGDYFVAALEPAKAGQWHSAAFLAAVAREAIPVTVAWDTLSTRDLVVRQIP